MASIKEVREEREAPTIVVNLTECELRRAMESALSSLGEPAVYTLAEKLQEVFRTADFGER